MTRCILALTFTAMALTAQTASAWEALDNFVDDLASCCTFDTGPAINYGPPPAIYTPPPAAAPVVVPVAVAPVPCAPPPPAPACCEQPDCCEKMKACWQKWCNSWKGMCATCCPGSAPAPAYTPPYVTAPAGTASVMLQEQPYSVAYPPPGGYETYSDGPALDYGPTLDYGPATGTTSEVIPAPTGSI